MSKFKTLQVYMVMFYILLINELKYPHENYIVIANWKQFEVTIFGQAEFKNAIFKTE